MALSRRNRLASHGLVRFPVDDEDWKNSGEGGMSVFAVWKTVPDAVCAFDVAFFGIGNLVSEWATREEHENGWNADTMESVCGHRHYITVASAVYLGSSGGSWWNDREGRYWEASRDDLTVKGLELLKTLEALHGDRALLLTVLDT